MSNNKKSKKKKSRKEKTNGEFTKPNGIKVDHEPEHDGAEGEDQDSRTPTEPPSSPRKADFQHTQPLTNGASRRAEGVPDKLNEPELEGHHDSDKDPSDSKDASVVHDKISDSLEVQSSAVTDARLLALAEERDLLREEVAQVRRALEEIQGDHDEELSTIREQLAGTRGEKEQAEAQYRGLLGKVSTIRSQLGERLKADAVCPALLFAFQTTYRSIGGPVASS